MAKKLIALIGPDGQTILAEPGGAAYQRLLSKGFVDHSRDEPKPTIVGTAREIVSPITELVAGMSCPEPDTEIETQSFDLSPMEGTIGAVEIRAGKRGRKHKTKDGE